MSDGFEPTRAAGFERLRRFVPDAGRQYRDQRNHDRGPHGHRNVSRLSPYLRHRLLGEAEVLAAVLAQHSRSAAEKFISEVFWRGYWKGWLEQRPSVWADYLEDLGAAGSALGSDADLSRRYQAAVDGVTGILPFDSWSRELVETGYLHNHARMWFASIWIFTLRLPWELGADFFLRHLLDGDPASNTLSWRWVAGLHTRGKTYLATAANIRRYASERFDMDAAELGLDRLASQADALETPQNPPPVAIDWPETTEPASRAGVLLTEEDLLIDFPIEPLRVSALRVDAEVSPQVGQFRAGALAGALAEAAVRLPEGAVSQRAMTASEVVAWASANQLSQVWVAYAPVGFVRSHLEALGPALSATGVQLVPFVRTYDRLVWPHCSKGFFQLRKRIPDLLDALEVDGATASVLALSGD